MTTDQSDARRVSEIRDLLPTTLGSAEIRDEIAADVLARSVFSARVSNVIFLAKIKEVIDAIAAGEMDKATARVTLLETLREIGYTPEGGFPDAPEGEVPPALAGTLQDLSSRRRLQLIIDTQAALMAGRGWQLRGMTPERMKAFPAWELVRTRDRNAPRNWRAGDGGTPPIHRGEKDFRSRWTIAGGRLYEGRMIALKGDPVWGELGSSGNFDDALDTDHPPFAWNSGMGWREIDRGEARALGVTGPDGETTEQWAAQEHPVIGPPPPVVSVREVPPELAATVSTPAVPAVVIADRATPAATAGEVRERIEAIDTRSRDRLAAAIARRQKQYQSR